MWFALTCDREEENRNPRAAIAKNLSSWRKEKKSVESESRASENRENRLKSKLQRAGNRPDNKFRNCF